jgi:hypothetical protein
MPAEWARGAGRTLAVLAAFASLAGCASGPVLRGGSWRDLDQGWTIAAPPGAWRRVRAEGADLALRRGDGVLMSVTSRCEANRAAPELRVRDLRPDGRAPLSREALEVAGAPAFAERFEVERGGRLLRVETAARVGARCAQDFALVAPAARADAGLVFSAWLASFRDGESSP